MDLKSTSTRNVILYSLLLLVLMAGVLFWMGRPIFYKNGPVKLWVSEAQSVETSQQFADPYTLTHVEHGIGFYAFLVPLAGKLSLGSRGLVAIALEVGWEIIENSPFIIDRYRSQTVSLDYYGDSIFNSFGDLVAMVLGLFIAGKMKWWHTLLFVILTELALLYFIGDNLLLNIIQLI